MRTRQNSEIQLTSVSMLVVLVACAVGVPLVASSALAGEPPAPASTDVKAPAAPIPAKPLGLQVGDKAPAASMVTAEGKDMRLEDLIEKGPIVVVFYRGGWCPYCNTHLQEWNKQAAEVKALGGTVVAISPEAPPSAEDDKPKDKMELLVLSDTKQEAMKGFKLNFTLSEQTQKKYKGMGLDIAKKNASKTWDLPYPATYVIDKGGTIKYAVADANFTKRPKPAEALNVLRELAKTK